MGGYPPLGYDVKERKLVVNEAEAETVPQPNLERDRRGGGGRQFLRLAPHQALLPRTDMVTAIFNGRQPAQLTANRLMEDTRLPLEWKAQRELFCLL